MKKKTWVIATSVAAIALCSSLVAGSTLALFTSESQVDIAITSGKVAVKAEIVEDSLALTSMGVAQEGNTWENGGTAGFGENANLTLNNITPGDAATFGIKVTNESSINIQYRLAWSVEGSLADVIETEVVGASTAEWTLWTIPQTNDDKVKEVTVSVKLPETVGNDYQNASMSISFAIEAVQGNASTAASAISIARKGVIIDYANLSDALEGLEEYDHLYINTPGEYGNLIINKNNVTVTGKVGATKAESTVFAELQTGTGAKGTKYATGVTFENLYCEYAGTNSGATTYHTGNNVTYKNCTFVGTGSKTGTALYVHVPTITITGCTFENWNSALYTCGDNHAAADITISNNTFKNVYAPFDGYWGKKADNKTQYNIKFTDNVIENDGDEISYVQLWDYTQYLNDSAADRQGSAVKALVSGNTGAFDLYMTHANLLWATDCTLELGDSQNVVYRSMVRFEGIKAVEETGENADNTKLFTNYTIYNADGSAMTTYNAISTLKVKDGYVIAYALPSGDYKIVNNATYTAYEFSVSDPAVGTVQTVTLGEGVLDGFAYNEAVGVWEISNANGLRNFAKEVNAGNSYAGKTVVLTNDIDLANKAWAPIGTDGKPFLGTFDGSDHTVSNLTVTENKFVGLFGYIDTPAVVKNLTVANANVEGYMCVGVIVGDNYRGTIDNATVLNSTIKSNRQTGGITGYSYGTVKNCLVDGLEIVTTPNMTDNGWDNGDKVGGIIGYGPGTYVLNNTAKNVEITAWRDLGGVAGYLSGDGGNKFDGNHAENVTLCYIEWYNEDGSRVLTVDGKVNQNIGALAGYRTSSDGENTTENVAVTKTALSQDTFIQSVASLQAGETLVLGCDVVVSTPIKNLKDVTIDANGHEIVINGINDVKGDNVTILNAVFSSENSKSWGICMDSVTFQNCTFDGVSPYLDGSKPIVIDNCIIKNTYLQLGERNCFDNVTITNNTFILNNINSESHAIVLGGSTKEYWENGAEGLVLEGNTFNAVNENDSYIAYYIYAAGHVQIDSVPVYENNTYNGNAYYSLNGTTESDQIKL